MNGIIERMLENAQEHGCLNEVVKSAIAAGFTFICWLSTKIFKD